MRQDMSAEELRRSVVLGQMDEMLPEVIGSAREALEKIREEGGRPDWFERVEEGSDLVEMLDVLYACQAGGYFAEGVRDVVPYDLALEDYDDWQKVVLQIRMGEKVPPLSAGPFGLDDLNVLSGEESGEVVLGLVMCTVRRQVNMLNALMAQARRERS